jgi:lipoprotein-anchoring transpeptidase ErfK/SrfK
LALPEIPHSASIFSNFHGFRFALQTARMNRPEENSALLSATFAGLLLAVLLIAALVPAAASQQPKSPAKPAQQAPDKEALTREEMRLAEARLAELGYWTGAVDSDFDGASRHALVAFQKVEGRKPTGVLKRQELAALLIAEKPLPRESYYPHVEIDLYRQVLLMVDDQGYVTHILPISSGNGEFFTSEGWTRQAKTPTGKFTVCRKVAGWRKSPLGLLFYPNYICGGIAIHGSLSVPVKPASHGCIRIPMFAAKDFSALTPVGTIVVVHNEKPLEVRP